MSNRTKGSQTSAFPDAIPSFVAQSELLDPATEDITLAEGRDANLWSAEILAIADALGPGGRGEVTVATAIAAIESLSYVYQGEAKIYAGETGRSLQAGVANYLYLDIATNAVAISTSAWPTTPHIRLAIWDDSVNPAVLTDSRPHTLQPVAEYPIVADVGGQLLCSGTATVPNAATSVAITFPVTFTAAPKVTLGCALASDSTERIANHQNKTTTDMTIVIDSAAPAGGVLVDWMAIGVKAADLSGSGS